MTFLNSFLILGGITPSGSMMISGSPEPEGLDPAVAPVEDPGYEEYLEPSETSVRALTSDPGELCFSPSSEPLFWC